MIGLENELLIKTGLIMKKKVMRKSMFGMKANGVKEGLTRSHKRRVQRLRNRELEQAQASGRPQVWRAKQIANRGQPSANIQMVFLLPSEFRAPTDQEVYSDFD